jgi:hypothetical protein
MERNEKEKEKEKEKERKGEKEQETQCAMTTTRNDLDRIAHRHTAQRSAAHFSHRSNNLANISLSFKSKQ